MAKQKNIEITSEIIAKAKAGDSAALQVLFRWIRSFLRSRARMPRNSQATASDITQDAAQNALRGLSKFQGTTVGDLEKWLTTIVHRRGAESKRNAHRDKRDVRQEVRIEEHFPEGMPAEQRTQSQVVANGETLRVVLGIVFDKQNFNDNYRNVIVWRLINKLPEAVIAQRMGTTVAAVNNLFRRALTKVRKHYAEETGVISRKKASAHQKHRAAVLVEYMRRCDEGKDVDVDTFLADLGHEDAELRTMLKMIEQLRTLDFKDDEDEGDT